MKNLLTYFLLLSVHFAAAQTVFSSDVSFNHMAFPVRNLEKSVAFYKDVLGLKEIANRSQNPNIRWMSLGGEKEIHFISDNREPIVVNKALHLALSTLNMENLIEHLRSKGIVFSDWAGNLNAVSPRADGVLQLYFQDPDGYWIEINNGYTPAMPEQMIKDAVWKLEEDYWMYVKQLDLDKYRSLWHERFMGYPSTNIIGGKPNITDWLTEMYAKNKGNQFTYALERKVENVFGEFVIVLYDATMTWIKPDGTIASQSTIKLTHTWLLTEKGWLIAGGMGAIK